LAQINIAVTEARNRESGCGVFGDQLLQQRTRHRSAESSSGKLTRRIPLIASMLSLGSASCPLLPAFGTVVDMAYPSAASFACAAGSSDMRELRACCSSSAGRSPGDPQPCPQPPSFPLPDCVPTSGPPPRHTAPPRRLHIQIFFPCAAIAVRSIQTHADNPTARMPHGRAHKSAARRPLPPSSARAATRLADRRNLNPAACSIVGITSANSTRVSIRFPVEGFPVADAPGSLISSGTRIVSS